MKNRKKYKDNIMINEKFEKDFCLLEKLSGEKCDEIFRAIMSKVLEVDFDKIVGYKLSEGQIYVILSITNVKIQDFLRDMIIGTYELEGRDNKRIRQDIINSLFVKGVIENIDK